jgi:transglutaminase-like putative cysteine protease
MDRRQFIKTTAALPAAAAIAGLPEMASAETGGTPQWRVFEVSTQVELQGGAGRVWLPVPLTRDTDYFKALGNTWDAPNGTVEYAQNPKYDMGIVSARFDDAAQKPALKLTSRFATRDRTVNLSQPGTAGREDPAVLKAALEPTEWIPTDGIVRETARDIIVGQRNDIDKARALYEWVVENTFRDPKVRGCGWGDIKAMLETKNLGGKCGDLNALWVGMARSVGIPARDVYGVRVAKSNLGYVSLGANAENISKAQHCRAEFYVQGYGWIPVDPADVRKVALEEPPGNLPITAEKVAKARERLFGSWEMNWLAYNRAHDIRLPGSQGAKLPYFMYPAGETAQGRLDSLEPDTFKYTMLTRELKLA